MNYSKEQQYAIIRILNDIMDADGNIEQAETNYCKAVCQELNLSVEEYKIASKLPFYQALLLVKEMTIEQKKYLGEMMQKMANADGTQDIYEHAVWKQVSSYAGL